MSAVSGIGVGVRRLSEICFVVGLFLLVSVFFLDRTDFLANLAVDNVGFFAQHFPTIAWNTDAFEQLGPPYGAADRQRADESSGPEDWMNNWTLFYWGWWISWSPFVGKRIFSHSCTKCTMLLVLRISWL